MGRNTLCWVDVSHYDGESCQRTLAREGARVLKVKVSRPHYKVNGSHRTQLTTSPRLPSQELIHTTSYTESIPVLTDLRFKLGDGTFTLPPIHGTATSTQQNPITNGTEVMEESQELKDNEENYEEATQRALDIQIWEGFVEREERGRISAMRRTPTPSLAPTPPKHASIHWAPFSADTKVSRASFHQWVQTVPALAESSIPWDKATRTGDDRIVVIIRNDNQNRVINSLGYRSGVTNPQYIRTTWTGMNLAATSSAIPDQETSPLMVAPVPNDVAPVTIALVTDQVGEYPLHGPASHFRKIAPGTWSFRLWNPFKRNQILRHPRVKKWMARFSPLEPASGSIDRTSLVLYNRGTVTTTSDEVSFALAKKTSHDAPLTAAISQFIDPKSEQAEQKWLLCFTSADEATSFYEKKQWVASAIETSGTTLGVRPNKGPEPQKKTNNNKAQPKRGGKGNAGGGNNK